MVDNSKGIIMFNRGTSCIVRAIVCLYSLRKHWKGPITFYLEDTPSEFDDVCRYFDVDIVHNDFKKEYKTLTRKTDMFTKSPYDRTLWLDSDTIVVGKLDEMFDSLDKADVVIPHFANWWSDGPKISKRILDFKGIAEDKFVDEALRHHPAINTGVLSWKKSEKWNLFATDWVKLADKGRFFISDEKAFQVLYPSAQNWGLSVYIAPSKFNVSVLHDHNKSDDIRVWHFHGKKHVLSHKNCYIWKNLFEEMRKKDTANINSYLQYADKRLRKYLDPEQDVTIVTACDEKYVEILRETFPNWVKYKRVDKHPIIVFVNGIDLEDERLNFLKQKNITLIPWDESKLDGVTDHRELMLSAFVFGTAEYVKTDYWLKLDADSFATNDKPLYSDDMKEYAYCGHKWGYSRPNHIRALDEWAKGHWRRKLKKASPMIEEGRIEGKRFYHNKKRTISFIQLHKTKFTKFCVKLCRKRKLPAPTQDTFMFFVCDRFDPHLGGHANFKKHHGFTQGNGRHGVEAIRKKLKEVDEQNGRVDEDYRNQNQFFKEQMKKSNFSIVNPTSDTSVDLEECEVEIREIK